MSRYRKLLNWEILRFSKIYGVLALITLVAQFVGIWSNANSYMNNAQEIMRLRSLSVTQYVAQFGPAKMVSNFQSLWFEGSIAVCAVTLLLYIFWIWYKEWLGKNTFAYRLLMLPTSRMNVYLAKLSALILFVWGIVALQFILLPMELALFNRMIPLDLRQVTSVVDVIRNNTLLHMVLPTYFTEFILYYGAGLMGVAVVFTSILLERSYRWKGIAAGIVYSGATVIIILLPFLLPNNWVDEHLYPSEVLLFQTIVGIGITALSLWFSSYLLRKKVTV
ncbi:hypothetical protein GCM10008018_22770 [Paenibacillus marchantiophytorum]|uniref:ABC transporter permease n=1 Tax=Paenibacillus marchantiophytorum TaxID=1619310 RepID=A0ABQ1ELB5_9BACL|nr:hypothetical protein [Paenibacillus marchantiophytorum]GFZ76759.1 hypothetical protein GCM10008018_22770 [Paenibacillus marchantiophytorum]